MCDPTERQSCIRLDTLSNRAGLTVAISVTYDGHNAPVGAASLQRPASAHAMDAFADRILGAVANALANALRPHIENASCGEVS